MIHFLGSTLSITMLKCGCIKYIHCPWFERFGHLYFAYCAWAEFSGGKVQEEKLCACYCLHAIQQHVTWYMHTLSTCYTRVSCNISRVTCMQVSSLKLSCTVHGLSPLQIKSFSYAYALPHSCVLINAVFCFAK